MALLGYARVLAAAPSLDTQLERLAAAGCEASRIYREAGAGRMELSRLLRDAGQGDVMVISNLRCLASSLRDLLAIHTALAQRGVALRSLAESWADTSASAASAVLNGLAGFERDLVRAHTGNGREQAISRGQRMGRPPKLTPKQRREAMQALASGEETQADLVRRYKVSKSTISRLAGKVQPLPGIAQLPLDPATEKAARAFLSEIATKYPVAKSLLFGSRARGDFSPDSDADIAVVLKGARGDRAAIAQDMAAIAFHVMMDTGVLVEALPLWEEELEYPESFRNPALIENIRRDGLLL